MNAFEEGKKAYESEGDHADNHYDINVNPKEWMAFERGMQAARFASFMLDVTV